MSAALPLASLLREGEVHAEKYWINRFGITESEFLSLLADGVLKISCAGPPRNYRFELVGMLFTRQGAFVGLPKIFHDEVDISIIRDVIACIRTYLNRVKRKFRHAEASEVLAIHTDAAKTIDLFLALIDWTVERGYHAEDFESRSDEPTDIDWGATMDFGLPMHVGRAVMYSEVVGRRVNYKLGPLAYLQSQAILNLHAHLKPASLFWLPEHDSIIEQAHSIREETVTIDDTSIVDVDQLTDFLNICNRDHDRELANILFDWLTERKRGSAHLTVFGTTSFQYVWEDMCDLATAGFGDTVLHQDVASQPVYRIGGTMHAPDNQRPDILRLAHGATNIFDAKWYDISKGDLPGTPDVIKSIMYACSIEEGRLVSRNAFLMPISEEVSEAKIIGDVRMTARSGDDMRFSPITIIGLPWKHAVSVYCGLSRRMENGSPALDFLRDGKT